MTEAYEIGIKLALDNGVSEGLALVRRDLAATDAAVEASAARLALFRRIRTRRGGHDAALGVVTTSPPGTARRPRPPTPGAGSWSGRRR